MIPEIRGEGGYPNSRTKKKGGETAQATPEQLYFPCGSSNPMDWPLWSPTMPKKRAKTEAVVSGSVCLRTRYRALVHYRPAPFFFSSAA
jgi:hypothetical protein